MKIALLRTWQVNIGNGFIDKGAKALLNKAVPDAEVIEVSGYPNWAADRHDEGLLPQDTLGKQFEEQIKNKFKSKSTTQERMVNVAEYIDVDIAVLPGCVLTPWALDVYRPTLEHLQEQGTEIIFLGVGGGDYKSSTCRSVRKVLEDIDPAGILTRDKEAYKCYSDVAAQSHDGIDCAFYISDWYEPPEVNTEISVHTFDKQEEPAINSPGEIIRPDHFPFKEPHGNIVQKYSKNRDQRTLLDERNNIFISDILEDYLFFYSNSEVTHSDRIHACVPTLSYGNKAQFWFDTPRGKLFDKVLDKSIKSSPAKLDQERISRLKSEQTNVLQQIVKESS